jgi:hypothetical protein
MPQFILESGGTVDVGGAPLAFHNLDQFTQGYIEALFFTEEAPGVDTAEFQTSDYQARMEEGQADGRIPGDLGFADLAPESLAEIIRDCAEFQARAAPLLAEAVERGRPLDHLGHDFWFTRNGHGAGFWDRSELQEDGLGERLSELCGWRTEFPEINDVYFDGERVHLS